MKEYALGCHAICFFRGGDFVKVLRPRYTLCMMNEALINRVDGIIDSACCVFLIVLNIAMRCLPSYLLCSISISDVWVANISQ